MTSLSADDSDPLDRLRDRPHVLLITPYFFGYELQIARELERQGWAVTLLDERPGNNSVTRAVLRVRPEMAADRVRRHYQRHLDLLGATDLDLVIVIKGEVVPEWFLSELRARHPNATVVGYTYDSLSNSGRFLALLSLFDRAFSFDRKDASDFGLTYLPLFHSPMFANSASAERRYDVGFVGTLHSDRFTTVSTLAGGLSSDVHMYVQARWYFALQKYVTRSARTVRWDDVTFRSLALEDVARRFGEARCVVDIQRRGQIGLTMRTFEALAAGAILVTSNPAIEDESFFDPARVLIFRESQLAEARKSVAAAASEWNYDPSWAAKWLEPHSLSRWVETLSAGRTPE